MQNHKATDCTRRLLIQGLAAGFLFTQMTLSAFAQNAAPPANESTAGRQQMEQVVQMEAFNVQGTFAGSLEQAAVAKEMSPAIVEIIAPEDIGKLPDVSIADALARLTGLTSQRVNGRDQDITIRGMGPDFNVGTLDGVEQATTDDNRAVEYDQYPSELMGGVTVFKTGQADQIGGIGGTVDLQAVSPLGADHRIFALQGFYNWTQFPQLTPGVKKAGESYTLSYIDQFAQGTEGLYVGYAHTENPYEGKQFQAWGPPYPGADSAGDTIVGGSKFYAQSELLKRDSVVAVLESKPNDSIHSKIDLFFSYYNDDQLLRGMEVPMAIWSSAVLQPGYTVSNGSVVKYTLTNIQPVVRNMDTKWTAHDASAIWNFDAAQKSEWPIHFQAGYSKATKSQEVLEVYSGLGFNGGATDADTFQVSQPIGQIPQITSATNYANPAIIYLTDPQGWGTGVYPVTGMEGYLKYFQSDDVADSYKLTTTHELNFGIVKDVELGASLSDRFKQFGQNPSGYLVNANGLARDPLPPVIGSTDLTFAGNLHTVAFDPNAAISSGLLLFKLNPNPGSIVGDNYKVTEDVTRPFFKFDLKGKLGDIPFDGNVGAQLSWAHQSSTGLSGNGGTTVVPVYGGATYADFLPSLNLTFKPTTKDFIRLFIGRQEQRPQMYQMRAARDYGYNSSNATTFGNSPWSGTAGNPGIRPWISNSFDLDIEHYFAHNYGYVSLAFFDKKLQSYIYQQSMLTNFAGYPITGSTTPWTYYGYTNEYVNGVGGNVSGLESTIQLGSEIFTNGQVRGLGIVLNGLIVDSSIKPWGPTQPSAPLNNMSKKTANVTIYYEYKGFSARISEHYQSQTREYIMTFGVPNYANTGSSNDGFSEEQPFHTIDAQLSYAFKNGALKGLTFYLDGRNLNNAALTTYNNGDPRQLMNWQKYGAAYRSGVSYKF